MRIQDNDQVTLRFPTWHQCAQELNGRLCQVRRTVTYGENGHPSTFELTTRDPVVMNLLYCQDFDETKPLPRPRRLGTYFPDDWLNLYSPNPTH